MRYRPILILLFLPLTIVCKDGNDVVGNTFYHARSQGVNAARRLAGTLHPLLPYSQCNENNIMTTISYGNTGQEYNIAQFLFFNGSNTMQFGNKTNPKTDVYALNFLLDDDFEGSVTTAPIIDNLITELSVHIDFESKCTGLYCDIYIPIGWTRWDMQLTEDITTTGSAIPANTFGNSSSAFTSLKSIIEAWKGNTINEGNFPDIQEKRKFGNVNGRKNEGRLADVETVIGYHVIDRPDLHIDINAHFIVPLGNKPQAHVLFEPIIGTGKHGAIGIGTTGYYELWDFDCDNKLSLLYDASLYHYFKSTQNRMFDLKENGIGSRYLMFKRFNSDGTYAGEILFGPNVTSKRCDIAIDFMSDITAMLRYTRKGLRLDAGSSFWIRSKEKISLKSDIPKNTFGIQGSTKTNDDNTASLTRINGLNDQPDATQVFLKTKDLNLSSAEHPSSASTKFFIFLSYLWCDHPCMPFFGLGGEYEYSQFQNRALDQWSGWLKAGFIF